MSEDIDESDTCHAGVGCPDPAVAANSGRLPARCKATTNASKAMAGTNNRTFGVFDWHIDEKIQYALMSDPYRASS